MCPSEVSDIEQEIWQAYRDRGVVVWGIASQDDRAQVQAFKSQMGLTFPVLFDGSGAVLDQYGRLRHGFGTIYPQDYIVGIDGKVAYVNAGYAPDEMVQVIEAELAR